MLVVRYVWFATISKMYFKKKLIILITAATMLFQAKLFAQITGSPHDFSGVSFVHGADGEICKVCHVPHNAGLNYAPLWRSELAVGTYALYSSDTLDATVNQPMAPTKACLTCHDGSIASGPLTGCIDCHKNYFHGDSNLGNDHPVSFTYDTALAQTDGALQEPDDTMVTSLGKTINKGMLYQERLECSSCHDVHATKGDSATAPHLLLVNNDQDSLCLTCHIK